MVQGVASVPEETHTNLCGKSDLNTRYDAAFAVVNLSKLYI